MGGRYDEASGAYVGGPGGVVKDDQTQNGSPELVWPGHPMRTKDNGTVVYMPVKAGLFQQSTVGGKTKGPVEQAKTFFGSSYLQNPRMEKWQTMDPVRAAIVIQAPGSPDDARVRSGYEPMAAAAHRVVELLGQYNVQWKTK